MATQAGITELENTYKTPINNEEIYFNGILDICSNRKISRIKSLALKTISYALENKADAKKAKLKVEIASIKYASNKRHRPTLSR
jgi:hypothetical protein